MGTTDLLLKRLERPPPRNCLHRVHSARHRSEHRPDINWNAGPASPESALMDPSAELGEGYSSR